MSGRPLTPTALKEVTGNPGKRPLNKKEPRLAAAKPIAPKHLTPRAKIAWRKLSTLLFHMNVLTQADALALERMCELYADIQELQEDIVTNGRSYFVQATKNSGMVKKPNPSVLQLRAADTQFRSYLTDFGLTPSARAKIQIIDDPQDDPIDDYFST